MVSQFYKVLYKLTTEGDSSTMSLTSNSLQEKGMQSPDSHLGIKKIIILLKKEHSSMTINSILIEIEPNRLK